MMVYFTQIFSIFPVEIFFFFTVILLGSAQSYCPPLIAKVFLAYVQDFEAILALSATETYGPMFILSYATSVLYDA